MPNRQLQPPTTPTSAPAPASKEARETKLDRLRFLEEWSHENPLATIEAARKAIKERYGLSLGTKVISDMLRQARVNWEAQRKTTLATVRPLPVPPPAPPPPLGLLPPPPPAMEGGLPERVSRWASEMAASGVRLLELLPDGNVRMELAPIRPGPQAS